MLATAIFCIFSVGGEGPMAFDVNLPSDVFYVCSDKRVKQLTQILPCVFHGSASIPLSCNELYQCSWKIQLNGHEQYNYCNTVHLSLSIFTIIQKP